MNVDSSANIGSNKPDEPDQKTIIANKPQIPSSAPVNTTVGAKAQDAPTISVSAPGGEKQLKFDQPFRAAHTAYAKSRPHSENDLIKLYGLGWLEASVARIDPKTGKKINRLRKSYEGQIKSFGLAGRNKATPHNGETDGMSLLDLGHWPEEEFYVQKVQGKEAENGLSSVAKSKIEKALNLMPGRVPRNADWENVLGLDKKGVADDSKARKPESQKEDVPLASSNLVRVNGYVNGGTTSVPEIHRPKRAGKKRSYIDSSFEGYGEGFDDGVQGDDSSNEGSRRSSNSRQKRQKSSHNFSSSLQGGNYAVGVSPTNQLSRGISSYAGR